MSYVLAHWMGIPMRKYSLGLLALTLTSAVALGSANAADIYVPSAPGGYKDSYVPVTTWTGFYVGAHGGGVWGDEKIKDDIKDGVPPGPFPYSASGAFGGGTLGYNVQRAHFVFGVEADIGYMDLHGSTTVASSNPIFHQNVTLDGGAYGDVTGRFGYAFDRTLIYAKGGFAFYDGEGKQATTKPGYSPTGTDTFTGWTAGAGVEHFINPAWSIKAEYLHFDFGTQVGYQTNVSDPGSPLNYRFHNWTTVTADSVKVGVNYHVGPSYEPLK
jgi:outer membrane immunogenic protein